MRTSRRLLLVGLLALVAPALPAALSAPPASAQQAAPPPGQTAAALTAEQKRAFLLTAKVIRTRAAGKGITGSLRLTLSDGTITHDAGFQSIDDRTSVADRMRGRKRAGELDFVDSYKYNIAAYEIARLLDLDDMMPVTVERVIQGRPGSLSWWVDEVLMDELQREQTNTRPPDSVAYSRQRQRMVIFAELVRDTDRNKGNILYTRDWRLVMIDFSRAFRLQGELRFPETLQNCGRALYAALRALTEDDIRRVAGEYLTRPEISAVLERRALIVERFDRLIRDRGEAVVLNYPGI